MARMDDTEYIRSFAEIALSGLNLQNGQSLFIRVEPENFETALFVAEEAYRRGARYVDMRFDSTRLIRTRIEHSEERYLTDFPSYRRIQNEEFIRDRWAYLSLKSPYDPTVLDGVDVRRNATITKQLSEADRDLQRAAAADRIQWLVMAVPSVPWAAHILGLPADDDALARLWSHMASILRFEAADPAAFWWERMKELERRAEALDALQIDELHFIDEGTDLRVGLHQRARWIGGPSRTPDGTQFIPNIPTEEVFTAPDARRTVGRVAVTKSVRVMGTLVSGAWFEFEGGRVVRFGAEKGAEALEQYLAIDPGSARLGEIALVDRHSPIARSGLVFQNTLLDENAACHMALGFAYPNCVEGGEHLDEGKYEEYGLNTSRQHSDVMISSESTVVRARLRDGSERDILVDGEFTL